MSEPVAWRVKDFADGWVYCTSYEAARGHSYMMADALIQPLYATDRIEALEARIAALRLAIGTVNGLILQPTENPLLDKIEDICDGAFAADDRARAALSPTPER